MMPRVSFVHRAALVPARIDTTDRHALEPFLWVTMVLDAGPRYAVTCGMVGEFGAESEDCLRLPDARHDTVSAAIDAALDHVVAVHTPARACCRCCEAAAERGELDHELSTDRCPYPRCDWCQP